jgi:hypothetical protein
LPASEFETKLLEIFFDWRRLIKLRANIQPGSQEREWLDKIYYDVLPIIARIGLAPTTIDLSLARELLNQVIISTGDDGT